MSALDPRIFQPLPPADDLRLGRVYVPPEQMDRLLKPVSTVVSMPSGSGKSALVVMGQHYMTPNWLHVTLTDAAAEPERNFVEVIQTIATRILWRKILDEPLAIGKFGALIKGVRFFLDRCFGRDLATLYLEQLSEEAPQIAETLGATIRLQNERLFATTDSPREQLELLARCFQKLGLSGLMIWLDLDASASNDSRLRKHASDIFDSVDLINSPILRFKCVAPPTIAEDLARLRGPMTLRVDWLEMGISSDLLLQILDRRTQEAGHEGLARFADLVDPKLIQGFVHNELGGASLTQWLLLAKSLAEEANRTGQVPISTASWESATRMFFTSFVKIRMDSDGIFWRGAREVLSPRKRVIHKVLSHLYNNPAFHKTYKLANALDISQDNLHTYINRARDELEPCPGEPIYIVTDERLEAYALRHTDRWD